MHINIYFNCPECHDKLKRGIFVSNREMEIGIEQFEKGNWYCKNCGKMYYTGTLEILTEEEVDATGNKRDY